MPPIGTGVRMDHCSTVGDRLNIVVFIQFDKDSRQIDVNGGETLVGRRMIPKMNRQRYGMRLFCITKQINRKRFGMLGRFLDVN